MSNLLLRGFAVLAGLLALGAARQPNFSGYWQLEREKSKVSDDVKTMWMRIEQTESTVVLNFRAFHPAGDEENQVFVYTIGNAENRNSMHGAPMKTGVEWHGDDLEFHSLAMFGKTPLTMEDTWTLSRDGTTLSYREKSKFGTEAEREAVYVFTRREAKDWPPDTSSEPVEKQFQNIQVLTGRRSSELPGIMQGFTRALGVQCTHCHVPGEFARDEKPEKQIARKMIAMTAKMNSGDFGWGKEVTCWTCHRGALKPEGAPK